MSAIDDVIAAMHAVQQQIDATLTACGQAVGATDSGYQLAVHVGSQSTVAGLQQVRHQIEGIRVIAASGG